MTEWNGNSKYQTPQTIKLVERDSIRVHVVHADTRGATVDASWDLLSRMGCFHMVLVTVKPKEWEKFTSKGVR